MTSKEDELVNVLIDRQYGDYWEQEPHIEPEAHYDDYGNRGVVDLYVRQNPDGIPREVAFDHLYEVKSASAIRNATGANEIIRQFNSMRQSFYGDDSRRHPSTVVFELTFTIEPAAVFHVAENISMYASAESSSLYNGPDERPTECVFFRSLRDGETTPVHIKSDDGTLAHSVQEWIDGLRARRGAGKTQQQRVLAILEDNYETE